jgi:ketosteroid isomerase-like protein
MTSSTRDIAMAYIRALESGAAGDDIAKFFSPDAVVTEFPNRFTPNGATRDLENLRAASERGKKVMQRQRYDIVSMIAEGDRVAIELDWTGTLSVPVGSLPAGGDMRAHVAVVLDFRDGKIVAQRHYDCYEAF